MSETLYDQICSHAAYLNLDLGLQELAKFVFDHQFDDGQIKAVSSLLEHLASNKRDNIVATLLKMSRLPLKEPKTFDNFDYSRLHGKNIEALKELSNLSALYARKNLAFIVPPGVCKTHLAMAYGRLCCEKGLKAYFLKATELNQKLLDARKYGREANVINGLVKPSCLIIDEVGRCVFDKENTRMFFDIIDRRYNKELPNTLILTSNKSPDKWSEFFSEDSSLLCALDRIFDAATVFMIKGNTYRGRKCETVALSTRDVATLPKL